MNRPGMTRTIEAAWGGASTGMSREARFLIY